MHPPGGRSFSEGLPPTPDTPQLEPSTALTATSSSSSTSSLPHPFPFLASPSILHRRVSSQVRSSTSSSASTTPHTQTPPPHLRWAAEPMEGRTGWSLLDQPPDEPSHPHDSDESSEDGPTASTSLISGPRAARLRRLASMGNGLIAAQREPRELSDMSTSAATSTSTSAASSLPSSAPPSPFPTPTPTTRGLLSPPPSAPESSPDALSSGSFFSSSPPSSLSLSFLNTLLLFDRSCATLCVLNLTVYLIGVCCLLLLARVQPQPRYVTTYQAGFWHAFHVWCCLAATLLLFVLFSQPNSKKQRISAISLCILTVCVLTYLIFALQLLPVYVDLFGHELFPLRYLEWICTTPLMLLLVCNLDVQPVREVVWIVAADVGMIAAGLFASMSPTWSLMAVWTVLSFLFQLDTLWRMHVLFVHYRRLVVRYPRITRTVNFLECWLYLTYAWFPAVWLGAAVGCIDNEQTAALYFMGDTLGKMLYTASLLIINLEIIDYAEQLTRVRYEADMRVRLADERMRSEEQGRHLAQVSNERKREFIRYLLHEVRVPLNALVLGLESLKINCDTAMQGAVGGIEASPAQSPRSPKRDSLARPAPPPPPQQSTPDLTSGRTLSRAASLELSQASSAFGPPSPGSERQRQAMWEEDSEAIHQMWISVSNMTRLLDDVLSLQRIEDGELLLERSPFHMQDTAKGAVKMMASWLDNKGLRVSIQLDPTLPPVISDEYRIRQILLNFLSNAIRFTPGNDANRPPAADDEDIIVRVERCAPFQSQEPSVSDEWAGVKDDPLTSPRLTSASSPPHSSILSPSSSRPRVFVRMSVRDRGIGLAKDDLGRLFMPFVQINAGEAEKGKGTGLGLSICRQLIEMLGGRIGVISEADKGSEFFVEAPFELHQEEEEAEDTSPAKLKGQPDTEATLQSPGAQGPQVSFSERIAFSPAAAGAVPASLANASVELTPTPSNLPSPAHSRRESSQKVAAALLQSAAPTSDAGKAAGEASSAVANSSSPPSTTASAMAAVEPAFADAAVQVARPLSLAVPSTGGVIGKGEAGAAVSMRVLVVDDAESNRKLLARLVAKSLRCVCDTARDGQEAVDMVGVDVRRYDVILCDKEMPVLDGYGAVRAMRAMGVVCPIIGVTANALLNDQAEFMACGLDALVTKPVNMQNLLSAIRDTTQQRKQSKHLAPNG